MDVDWDLYAVVRGCTLTPINRSGFSADSAFASDDCCFSSSSSMLDQFYQFHPNTIHESPPQPREELYDPFFPASGGPAVSPGPGSSALAEPKRETPKKQSIAAGGVSSCTADPHALRSKRRKKSQFKKVCQVAAEGLLSSDDTWSWRKYGQKPIKGSPYPRGYYRCSSSKGCPARKQVERDRSDPNKFIVTYSADHNHPAPTHRNSLAGTTRLHRNNKRNDNNNNNNNIYPISTEVQQQPWRSSCVKAAESELEEMINGLEEGDEYGDGGLFLMDDDFFDWLDAGDIGGGDGAGRGLAAS